MRRRGFTALDGLILGALLTGNLYFLARGGGGSPSAVEIVSASGTRTEHLAGARDLAVPGPLGQTLVRLGPEGVRVVESPCPLKLCVAAGLASRPGQVVACLPNRVALRVLGAGGGTGQGGLDAVGR